MNYKDKYAELCKQLNTDSLTKILSRHYIDENFENIICNSLDRELTVCLALFDIDNFKNVNDTYGHIAGDDILRQTAEALKKLLVFSDNDFLARYGGDEFILLSVGISYDSFTDKILTCVANIAKHKFYTDKSIITLSVSAGCADLKCRDFIYGLNVADKKLYTAKQLGRNRAEI